MLKQAKNTVYCEEVKAKGEHEKEEKPGASSELIQEKCLQRFGIY